MSLSLQIIIAIAYAFAGCYVLYILFFYMGFRRLKPHLLKNDKFLPPLTVIVCARDEEENIETCVRSILAQEYPKDRFSLIVVNDRSEDRTQDILEKIASEDQRLRVVHLRDCPPDVSPKKNAISHAIEFCNTEYIVATDADTRHPKNWLKTYGSLCEKNVGAATGICLYKKDKFSSKWEEAWQSMQTIENLSYSMVIAGAMVNGFAITAHGGNMMFRKELFESDNPLKKQIVTGDDSDIVYEAQRRKYLVLFNAHPDSVVNVVPEKSIKDVINQRIRWASHTMKATFPVVVLGLTVFLFYASLILLPFLALADVGVLPYWGGLVLIKAMCDFLYMSLTMKKFKIPFKFIHLFLMELVHAPFIVWVGLYGTFGNFTWKGTSYKKTLGTKDT